MAHVYVEGPTTIGADNLLFPFTSVGVKPQDLKYAGERSQTVIGDRNQIHEFVTVHRGTTGGGMVTRIGDDNLLMAYVHVAHDVQVGNHCVLANGATCGGHVIIGDWAVVGAFTGLHQFCRVGAHAIIGGYSVVTQDVLPYATVSAPREVKMYGANRTGLERRGFANETIEGLQAALKLIGSGKLNTSQAVEKIRAEVPGSPELDELLAFIASSQRGFLK